MKAWQPIVLMPGAMARFPGEECRTEAEALAIAATACERLEVIFADGTVYVPHAELVEVPTSGVEL